MLLSAPTLLGASLLFCVEPMFAKLLLPVLGGSPGTWAACLCAFQLLLLAGYTYAHLSARFLPERRQALLHAALLIALGAHQSWVRLGAPLQLPGTPNALAVVWLVVVRLGPPFVLLAATTPLLIGWARALSQSSRGLYRLSNAGSLLGLSCYPLVLERYVGLPAQLALWAAGFVLFELVLLPVCIVVFQRSREATVRRAAPRVGWRERLFWLIAAALPSALLVAVTNHITVDVAATPVLWAAPLAVYLASYVVVFGPWGERGRLVAHLLWLGGAGALALSAVAQGAWPLSVQLGVALAALTGGCLLCHGELARRRPSTHESGFFLTLALGGALGGAFVSVLAPLLFADFYELELLAACIFALLLFTVRSSARAARFERLVVYLGFGLCAPLLLGEVALRATRRSTTGRVIERRRSFLGPVRVVETSVGRSLTHGHIQHGLQLRPPRQHEPTLYFGRRTAIGEVLGTALPDAPARRIGVVGLGVGTLASYGRRGDVLRFYELDHNVVELARRHFSFIRDSAASVSLLEGDGRLLLARELPQAFDVLVLDAFSSDAVPVHLLTREAFEVYRRHLAPRGFLVANVSNRHLAIERVVRASAATVALACEVYESENQGVRVRWAVMTSERERLDELSERVRPLPERTPQVTWTDSKASLLDVLR